MPAPDSSPLQSFFRLVIMAGTAIVGGMALKVYGPPPEKIGPLVERGVSIAKDIGAQVMAHASEVSEAGAADTAPSELPPAAPATPRSPLTPAEFRVAQASSPQPFAAQPAPAAVFAADPAVHRSPSTAAAIARDPSLEPLVARLEAANVEHLELAPWGAAGQLIRCSCTAPVVGTGLRRMVDTIEPNAHDALRGILIRLQAEGAIAQAH